MPPVRSPHRPAARRPAVVARGLVLAGLLVGLLPAGAHAATGAEPARSGRVVVTLERGAEAAPRDAVAAAVDAAPADVDALPRLERGDPRTVVVEPGDTGLDPAAEARRLETLPGVADAHPEALFHLAADPLVSDAAPGTWGLFASRAREAWSVTTGTPAAPVAVVDDGVDFSNPDLAARRSGAGGYDAVTGDADPSPDGGWHGTHVAGVVAASADGQGVTGVAPSTALLGVRACTPDGACRAGDIVRGVTWAVDHGARVVNLSVTGPVEDPYLTQAIASHPRTTFVVAAGNEGRDLGTTPSWPCVDPAANVVCVGAVDRGGALAPYSNRGAALDVVAPGTKILSTTPGGTGSATGTSMAAPHVSGAAALVAGVAPGLDGAAIAGVLRTSARATGAGRALDVAAAVGAAPGAPAAPAAGAASQSGEATTVADADTAAARPRVLAVRRAGSRIEVRLRCPATGRATVALGRSGTRSAPRRLRRTIRCPRSRVAKARLRRPSRARRAVLLLRPADGASYRVAVKLPRAAKARARR